MENKLKDHLNSNWIDKLKEEFSYCDYIEMISFPSTTPEFFTGFKLECKLDHFPINKERCMGCADKFKFCDCYHTVDRIIGWDGDTPLKRNESICWGTKDCEVCSCGGDRTKCNFYK